MLHPVHRRHQTLQRGRAAKAAPAAPAVNDQTGEYESVLDAMYRRIDEDLLDR